MTDHLPHSRSPTRTLISATATPLASIFGSGFLIVVPALVAALGRNAPIGMLLVCLVAWFVGSAVRVGIRRIEPIPTGELRGVLLRIEQLSVPTIIAAYVVSVALYLRVLAAYVWNVIGAHSLAQERALVTVIVIVLTGIGMYRGFSGLERIEKISLGVALVLVTALIGAFAVQLAPLLGTSRADFPTMPGWPQVTDLLVLGGLLICVQGFETTRFLGAEYPADVRIRASAWSQVISTAVYLLLTLVATPLMLDRGATTDADGLLDLVRLCIAVFTVPLVLTAVLSQLSAAIADLATAVDGTMQVDRVTMPEFSLYAISGAATIAIVWVTSTYGLVALASRAFAAYYALQCCSAAVVARSAIAKVGWALLAIVMVLIVLFARPAT